MPSDIGARGTTRGKCTQARGKGTGTAHGKGTPHDAGRTPGTTRGKGTRHDAPDGRPARRAGGAEGMGSGTVRAGRTAG